MKLSRTAATVTASATLLVASAAAAELQTDLKLKLSGYAEGARDLGLPPDDPAVEPLDDTSVGTADANLSVLWQKDDLWAAYLRAQGFTTTDELTLTDEEQPRQSKSFVAAREFWLQYGGLTAYPGEYLRLGRQRLREVDGTWLDQDIEALRWVIDTTLFQAQIGAAEAFHSYRSDDPDEPLSLHHRAYGFASIGWEWTPQNRIGLRATHAFDDVDLDREIAKSDQTEAKLSDRDLTWLGLQLQNNYFDTQQQAVFAYYLEGTYLFGKRRDAVDGGLLDPVSIEKRDVRAWAADAAMRIKPSPTVPLQFGLAYAYSSGGGDAERDETYEQTGLQSNRSRLTGTRALVYRYGEALQPDLGNLGVASAFVAVPLERWDASLIYHRYSRDDDETAVRVDGVDVQPTAGSGKFIGQGYDLVTSYYFGKSSHSKLDDGDDLRSNIRLRGSLFQPDKNYAEGADDQYRVTLEATLWF